MEAGCPAKVIGRTRGHGLRYNLFHCLAAGSQVLGESVLEPIAGDRAQRRSTTLL
jgi:hypothetical protein